MSNNWFHTRNAPLLTSHGFNPGDNGIGPVPAASFVTPSKEQPSNGPEEKQVETVLVSNISTDYPKAFVARNDPDTLYLNKAMKAPDKKCSRQ